MPPNSRTKFNSDKETLQEKLSNANSHVVQLEAQLKSAKETVNNLTRMTENIQYDELLSKLAATEKVVKEKDDEIELLKIDLFLAQLEAETVEQTIRNHYELLQ
jgi:chromosome segregation ATPase